MLHYIAFSNFCSFQKRSVIDLRLSEGGPVTDLSLQTSTGERVAKVMGLIGPNAAGKTNGLRALSFLSYFLRESFRTLAPEARIPVDAFLFQQDRSVAIEFEIEIDVKGIDYLYTCALLPDQVVREQLKVRGESGRYRTLLKREKMKIEIAREGIGIPGSALEKMVRGNSSVIALLHQLENGVVAPFVEWFEHLLSNTTRLLSHRPHSFGWTSLDAAQLFGEDEVLLGQVIDIVATADLGIDRIELSREKFLDEETGEQHELQLPFGVHTVEGKEYRLPLMMESDGTQTLFILLSKLLPVLRSGGCAVINDLETDLHPDILPAILHLFIDQETNPRGAQLIFTTHAHELVFTRLDKRMISIVEKVDGLSTLYRLDSLEGIRNDVDLLKKYRAGLFGGVPNI